jgi:YesN/AraC family two-component response regulator
MEQTYNLIIIDDDNSIINSLKRELKFLAKKNELVIIIETFYDPDAGLNYLYDSKNKVDLLITDIKMPFMTGDVLVAKTKEKRPALPIIVITGFATKEAISSIFKTDINAVVLTKPWNQEKLASAVFNLLGIKKNIIL